MVSARILGLGSAVPAPVAQRDLWDSWFVGHHRDPASVRRLWSAAGVTTRHAAIDPRGEDVSGWSTGARMQRYIGEALPLASSAIHAALDDAGIGADEVDSLTVVSCTGYATPGLDVLLAEQLGLPDSLQRLMVGHMGCFAAVPALATVADAARARRAVGVLACVEVPSLHVQPPCDDLDQVVAHALFGDAAAAVVVGTGGPGLEVVDVAAHTETGQREAMTWEITDLGFRMGLSPRVPGALARTVAPLVATLLARHGLRSHDVAGWAIHPGGPRILEVCADKLGLDETAMSASWATLDGFGNCSSATVLLVLERLLGHATPHPGDPMVLLAFGPGLTLYVALLRQRDDS